MSSFIKKLLRGKPKHPRAAGGAGHLYPEQRVRLQALVMAQLREEGGSAPMPSAPPRALFVPAGDLEVAGKVAARAYQALLAHRAQYTRVALIAPALRIPFAGVAVSAHDAWDVPNGQLRVDQESLERLLAKVQGVRVVDEAHRVELSLELQLPYLCELNPQLELIPLLVGDGAYEPLLGCLRELIQDEQTLLIISADLANELEPALVAQLNEESVKAIRQLDVSALSREHTSGLQALRALVSVAREQGWQAAVLEHSRSDLLLAAPGQLSVGYAAAVFCSGN